MAINLDSFPEEIQETVEYLKNEVRYWETVFDKSICGTSVIDGSGQVLYANQALQKLYQLTAEDFVGKNISELVKRGIFNMSVAQKIFVLKKPVSIMQEISSGIKCLTRGVPVFQNNGEIKMIVVNSHDVTELYLLKEKLLQSKKLADGYKVQLSDMRITQLMKEDVIVRSKKMLDTLDLARRLAAVDTTVLILGESGVGKEVVARLLHKASSKRLDHAFITINCGAVPHNLLEAELFGYERGAFTGASKEGKCGLFELADGGSIFLDEVGELPLDLQVKFLRVLQERNFKRVGGTKEINVNVRVIAASNKNLLQLVNEGKFREDLYYRLNVVPIKIPPLRERQDDIVALVNHFVQHFNKKYQFNKIISSELVDVMERYNWPGNVRELKNIVERMMVTSGEEILRAENFPIDSPGKVNFDSKSASFTKYGNINKIIEDVEFRVINEVLNNSKTTTIAAKRLGVSRATLARKMKKYGITRR
jgi:PAS domain S-box-containing protein